MTVDSDDAGRAAPARSRVRRLMRLAVRLTLMAVVAMAIGLAAVYVRLMFGPISSDVIARTAERVASNALGAGRAARVGAASLALADGFNLALHVEQIRIGEAGDAVIVNVPSASIRVKALPLLIGRVRPYDLEVVEPAALIDLTAATETAAAPVEPAPAAAAGGSVAAPAEPSPPAAAEASAPPAGPPTPALVRDIEHMAQLFTAAVATIRQEDLVSVSARHGFVEVRLPSYAAGVAPRSVIYRDVEVASIFGRDDRDADVSISARGSVGRWTTRLRQTADQSSGIRRVYFEGRDLTLPDLLGFGDPNLKVESPFYPYFLVEIGRDDQISVARLSLKLGAGLLRFGKEIEEEALLDEGELDVHWDFRERRFVINRLTADFGPTHVSFVGSAVPPVEGGTWSIRLDLEKGLLAARDVTGPPLPLDGAFVEAAFDTATMRLAVSDAQAHFGGAAVGSRGTVDFASQPFISEFDIASTAVDAKVLKRAWPHWVAAGARKWFIDNVISGRILPGRATVKIPLGVDPPLWPKDAVLLDGGFEAGMTRIFGELPPIIDAAGRVHLEQRVYTATLSKGRIGTTTARPPVIQSLRMTTPDAFEKPARGQFDFVLEGEALALAEIINSEPLSILDNATIRPDGMVGTASVHGTLAMVFDLDPARQNVVYKFDATADGFGSTTPIYGRRFSDGALKFAVDKTGTRIVGKAKIEGVPTDVNMFEPADKRVQERRDFSMMVDDAARTRLGLDFAGIVAGPMKVDIGAAAGADGGQQIDIDLTPSRLNLIQFGWTKGAGVPAKASFTIAPDPVTKGTRVDNFSVESEGLALKGQVQIGPQKQFIGADLSKFMLHKGDDAKLKVVQTPDGILNVNFDAASFDIRSLIQTIKQNGTPKDKPNPKAKSPDLNVKVRAARLIGYNDVSLQDAAIDAQWRSGALTQMVMTARSSGGRAVEIAIRSDKSSPGRRSLVVSSDDGGALIAFLDIYSKIVGGNLAIRGGLGQPGEADGTLQLIGFRLTEKQRPGVVPALRMTPDGRRELALKDAEISQDATFDRFGLRFSMQNGVINIRDGIAKGVSTGATAGGAINMNSQKLDIQGTFIPLYGLNNTVSRIPILGQILGGGQNEGLIGVTFQVGGSIDNPVLQFNPLSAVAPGLFRKIFEFRGDVGAGQAGQEPRGPTDGASGGDQ